MTKEEFDLISKALWEGNEYHKSRKDFYAIFMLMEGLGLHMEEILSIRKKDYYANKDYYFVGYLEYRTGKKIYKRIDNITYAIGINDYIIDGNFGSDELIFPLSLRAYQKLFKEIREECRIGEGSLRDARAYLVKGKPISNQKYTEEEIELCKTYYARYKELKDQYGTNSKQANEYKEKISHYIETKEQIE